MGVRVNAAGLPYKEYEIAITSTASTAINIGAKFKDLNGPVRVELEPKGDDAVIMFGNSSAVTAVSTVTSSALADGNFSLTEGVIEDFDAIGQSQGWISVISRTGLNNAGAILCVRLCAVNK